MYKIPKLKKGVLTQFPNCPNYLSKPLKKSRRLIERNVVSTNSNETEKIVGKRKLFNFKNSEVKLNSDSAKKDDDLKDQNDKNVLLNNSAEASYESSSKTNEKFEGKLSETEIYNILTTCWKLKEKIQEKELSMRKLFIF